MQISRWVGSLILPPLFLNIRVKTIENSALKQCAFSRLHPNRSPELLVLVVMQEFLVAGKLGFYPVFTAKTSIIV